MYQTSAIVALAAFLIVAPLSRAADLIIHLPAAMKPTAASAQVAGQRPATDGEVKDQTLTFHNLTPGTSYDVKVTLADGTILQGVDMSWYNDDPPKQDAGPFNDDDRKEIQAIMDVKSFYNKSEMLQVSADHDRATILTQLIRDTGFDSDAGDEVIWRIELCYYQNQYGGWAKLNQVNKVVRRVRFKTHDEYTEATAKLQWLPALGGIILSKEKPTEIIIPPPTPAPTSQPAKQPGDDEER